MTALTYCTCADLTYDICKQIFYKLDDSLEAKIEEAIDADLASARVAPEDLGKATRLDDALGRYIESLKRSIPRTESFEGLKVVVDCAHGAAYKVAPQVLWDCLLYTSPSPRDS